MSVANGATENVRSFKESRRSDLIEVAGVIVKAALGEVGARSSLGKTSMVIDIEVGSCIVGDGPECFNTSDTFIDVSKWNLTVAELGTVALIIQDTLQLPENGFLATIKDVHILDDQEDEIVAAQIDVRWP